MTSPVSPTGFLAGSENKGRYCSKRMDLYQELLPGSSKASIDRITNYIQDDPVKFSQLYHYFLSNDGAIQRKAIWALSCCVEKWSDLIIPYCKELIPYLQQARSSDGVKRNILRLFQFIDIPENIEEDLLANCFDFLANCQEAVAVRVFAMQLLAKLSLKYPEIKNELDLLIEDELPYAQPAFVNRGRKILAGRC